MLAAVRFRDGRDIFRVDIGLCIGIILWPLVNSVYMGSVSWWLTRNIDRGSYEPDSKGESTCSCDDIRSL